MEEEMVEEGKEEEMVEEGKEEEEKEKGEVTQKKRKKKRKVKFVAKGIRREKESEEKSTSVKLSNLSEKDVLLERSNGDELECHENVNDDIDVDDDKEGEVMAGEATASEPVAQTNRTKRKYNRKKKILPEQNQTLEADYDGAEKKRKKRKASVKTKATNEDAQLDEELYDIFGANVDKVNTDVNDSLVNRIKEEELMKRKRKRYPYHAPIDSLGEASNNDHTISNDDNNENAHIDPENDVEDQEAVEDDIVWKCESGSFNRGTWRVNDTELLKKTMMLYGLGSGNGIIIDPKQQVESDVQSTDNNNIENTKKKKIAKEDADEKEHDEKWTGTGTGSARWNLIRKAFLDSTKNNSARRKAAARYAVEDVRLCGWELCRRALNSVSAEAKDINYLKRRIENDCALSLSLVSKGHNVHIMSGTDAEKIGKDLVPVLPTLELQENAVSLWTKRMRILDMLADAVGMLRCENAEVRKKAEEIIEVQCTANPIPNISWWDHECDIAIINGVYDHGYGNYDPIRSDVKYSSIFQSKCEKDGKTNNYNNNNTNINTAAASGQFPQADTLTRRLKRLLDHLLRLRVRLKLPTEVVDPPTIDEAKPIATHISKKSVVWNKKEINELLRILLSFGFLNPVPQTIISTSGANNQGKKSDDGNCDETVDKLEAPEGCEVFWSDIFASIRDKSQLRHKSAVATEEAVEAIVVDALHLISESESTSTRIKDVFKSSVIRSFFVTRKSRANDVTPITWDGTDRRKGSVSLELVQSSNIPKVLTGTSAAKMLERLEMVDTFLNGIELLPENWEEIAMSKPSMANELPIWWKTGFHDKMLVMSVLNNGLGKFDPFHEELFDRFETEKEERKQISKSHPEVEETANAETLKEQVTKFHDIDEKVLPKSVEEVSDILTFKICFRRLRYMKSYFKYLLRSQMKKHVLKRKVVDKADEDMLDKLSSKRPVRRNYKFQKAVKIRRDEDGQPIMPINVTDRLTLRTLGKVDPELPGFHNERHIFPVGYVSDREHASMIHQGQRTIYTNEILDYGGTSPMFRVTPRDCPERFVEKDSASGAWVGIETAVLQTRGIYRNKVTVSGTEMFGLSHPVVAKLIQEMPNVDKCTKFDRSLSFYNLPNPPRQQELRIKSVLK